MDGVIVDSELYWNSKQFQMLKEHMPDWTETNQHKLIGLSVFDTYKYLVAKHNYSRAEEEYMNGVDKIARAIYRNECQLMKGFLEAIKDIKSKEIPIGLASSSKEDWIEIVVDRFNLKPYFDSIVSTEHIDGPAKPAPDIYWHTARQLGVEPENCTVIEDSNHGVTAGKAAGMYVIGFRNGFNQAQDLSSADREIEGYKEFDFVIKN
jgi:HAD superfamily hydrolase (TIGR01509 family)